MKGIYNNQISFNEKLHANIQSLEFQKEMLYALIAEVTEAGNEIPFKSWKKNQEYNKTNFIRELVDVQLFLFNLVASTGISYEEYIEHLEEKQDININRYKNNY